MLSRIADSMFWMSRYVARAEDTARLLDVTLGPVNVSWTGVMLIVLSVGLAVILQTYINRSRMGRDSPVDLSHDDIDAGVDCDHVRKEMPFDHLRNRRQVDE